MHKCISDRGAIRWCDGSRIDNELTVKRLKRKGNAIELLPENDALSPFVVDPQVNDFAIEGLAVGVIRSGGIH